jgi:hypothetical protein
MSLRSRRKVFSSPKEFAESILEVGNERPSRIPFLVFAVCRYEDPAGPPALVSAAKENLCSWTFASNASDQPLPLTIEYEYRIDKGRSSAQLNAQVTYDLPNHVTVTAPEYSPSCLCVKKRSKWKPWGN